MNDNHVPDDLLMAFVDGDVSEHVAVHLAEHLDACPSCATRAATLEPLHIALAHVPDPVAPDLTAAVLAVVAEPEPAPRVEVTVGLGLLAAAGILAFYMGDPVGAAVQITIVGQALAQAAAEINAAVVSSTLAVLAITSTAALSGMATLRLARLPEHRLS